MFVDDFTYKIGDTVNLFKDGFIPNRKWVITAIDERTGNYTLVTDHLAYLPDFAVLSDDGRTATVIANKLELKQIGVSYIPNPGPRDLSFSPRSPDLPPPSDVPIDPYNLENLPVSRREMIPGPRTPTPTPPSPTPPSPTPPRKPIPKYGAVPPPPSYTTTVKAPGPVAVSPEEDPFAQPYDVRSPSPIEKYLPPATMNRPMVKPPSGDESPIDKYLPSAGKEINILTDIADEKKEEENTQKGEKDENKKEIKIKLN
jgi:hypothetical protein